MALGATVRYSRMASIAFEGETAMTLTFAQARTILDKTLAAGREKKLKPLGVAVVDSRGALRAYLEEDGNPIMRSKNTPRLLYVPSARSLNGNEAYIVSCFGS